MPLKVLSDAPAPLRNPAQDLGLERLGAESPLGHRRVDPAGQNGIDSDAVAGVLDGEPAHHRR